MAVGQNDAISWPGLVTLLDGTSRAADYLKDLPTHGVNVSRVMMEYAERPHQLKGFV